MFLWDKSYKLKNFWYYILGSFIIILFSTFGQIPLMFYLPSEIPSPDSNPMDILKGIPSNLRLFLILISSAITIPGIWLTVTKLHDLRESLSHNCFSWMKKQGTPSESTFSIIRKIIDDQISQ